MTTEVKIQAINSIFRTSPEINIIEDFVLSGNCFRGKIELNAELKTSLLFDVEIPITYPLLDFGRKCSRFVCLNHSGYQHLNEDNSVCLVVPKCSDFGDRLQLEIVHLKEWRDKFYIREERDKRYDYLIVPNQSKSIFFFTDVNYTFQKCQFGDFEMVDWRKTDEGNLGCYITKIGNAVCHWSDYISQQPPTYKGFFYFIDNEPIGKGNISFQNWKELNAGFSQSFKKKLHEVKLNSKENFVLPILIGYKIPNTKEITWQIIEINEQEIPLITHNRGVVYYELTDQKIIWGKTHNLSQDRFFGRGRLTKKLRESNFLVIGCGALGSSLAKILARCGCNRVDIGDFDIVEPGNICRSEFFLTQTDTLKVHALAIQLSMISPFIDSNFVAISKDNSLQVNSLMMETLHNYDFVFDCSSDDELCFYLDSLNLNTQIINLSISNKAKELACIIGNSGLWSEVQNKFSSLESIEEDLFYEGIGCWNPTFEASYFDINSLLNLAIKNLNYRIENNFSLNSFVVRSVEQSGYLNLEVVGN